MRPMLGVSGPKLALCWPYVGFSWPSYCEAPFSPEKRKKEPRPLGLSLPYVGPVLDAGWRILSRCWAHVDVFWVYMGPMLGVSGPKLAMLAVCWPYAGFPWPSYCEAPFSFEKKKGTQAFGSYPMVFFDFHPRAMSSQLRCTCQLSGRGASAVPL